MKHIIDKSCYVQERKSHLRFRFEAQKSGLLKKTNKKNLYCKLKKLKKMIRI